MCVLTSSPNARAARREPAPTITPEAAANDMSLTEHHRGTFTVIVRVSHRNNKGEDKAHTIYAARGVPYVEAVAHAIEAGTSGVFEDLTYYPPHRVLTVRLSHDA
jgi:hypothetical protein